MAIKIGQPVTFPSSVELGNYVVSNKFYYIINGSSVGFNITDQSSNPITLRGFSGTLARGLGIKFYQADLIAAGITEVVSTPVSGTSIGFNSKNPGSNATSGTIDTAVLFGHITGFPGVDLNTDCAVIFITSVT